MNSRHSDLSLEQLWVAPELASLALLDAAIDMAILAVAAVHPEMQDPEPFDPSAALRAATAVIEDARALAASITRYRRILRRRSDHADDLAF